MNLEHALSKIHSRRHSAEVQLTLDVLKAGKRFHATVSFDADTGKPLTHPDTPTATCTNLNCMCKLYLCPPPLPLSSGLKEAQDKVNDYSPLMKDFPVNELLAAGSLEAIRVAVAAVYTHLRKIRTTSYPAQRAIYLVEAISRDLSTQLLKVQYINVNTLHTM